MSHAVTVFLFTCGLFFGMLLFLEIGRRAGIRRMKEDAGAAGEHESRHSESRAEIKSFSESAFNHNLV